MPSSPQVRPPRPNGGGVVATARSTAMTAAAAAGDGNDGVARGTPPPPAPGVEDASRSLPLREAAVAAAVVIAGDEASS